MLLHKLSRPFYRISSGSVGILKNHSIISSNYLFNIDKTTIRCFSAVPTGGDNSTIVAGDSGSVVDTTTLDVLSSVPAQLTYSPPDLVVRCIELTHNLTGLEYWGSIALFTLALRLVMAPINISAVRNGARMAVVRPEVDRLQKAMKADPRGSDMIVMQKYQSEIKAVFTKHQVNPLRSLIGPMVQIPVFASVFFGIMKFGDYYGAGYTTGGLLWFPDLSSSDPYHILPVVNAMSFLAMIELGADGMPQEQQGMFKWIMRGLSLFMIPFTLHLPTASPLYT
jgi:YidC/Oxa1 family membrane protein insertase